MSKEEKDAVERDVAVIRDVEEGNVEAVLTHLQRRVEINLCDEFGTTLVHKATCPTIPDRGNAMLKRLLELGVSVDLEDRDGASPIVYAIRAGNTDAVRLLLECKRPSGEYMVDLQQTIGKNGNGLMHEAAWNGRTEEAELLFGTGAFTRAELDKPNAAGQSVMHVASFQADGPFIDLLVRHGAQVDAPCDNNGRNPRRTPAQIAAVTGKPANAKFLNELSAALHTLRFAAKLRRKRASPSPTLHMRFEYDLNMFTADLEKAFIARLAKYAHVAPEEVLVLSRSAGSVILELELRSSVGGSAAAMAKATAAIERAPLAELSEALGYEMLDCAVGPRSAAAAPPAALPCNASPSHARRATPSFSPLPYRRGAA